ncbi:MAG: hypothetical protein Q7U23_02905 [Methylococcales bacterium]|nr:hypothetical protein [Methylococcales bacterium]
MKKINKTPFAAAMGVAVISTFAAGSANAEASPFGMTDLSQGYMQVAEAEMKCGANMKMDAPKDADAKAPTASCGNMMEDGKMKPGMEAACGAMMKGKEGACGMMQPGETMKGKEGACGEGAKTDAAAKAPEASCGNMMEGGKMKPGMESMCGAMMKGKEGACGMMADGEAMKSKEGSCGAAMKTPEDKAKKSATTSVGTKVIPYVPAAK